MASRVVCIIEDTLCITRVVLKFKRVPIFSVVVFLTCFSGRMSHPQPLWLPSLPASAKAHGIVMVNTQVPAPKPAHPPHRFGSGSVGRGRSMQKGKGKGRGQSGSFRSHSTDKSKGRGKGSGKGYKKVQVKARVKVKAKGKEAVSSVAPWTTGSRTVPR